MSMDGKDKGAPEIVIVRRKRGNGDDCHHGGVWKVAYADFMTAMMAFFLVMWLINAANEETRSQVASYFNPVKLVDTTTNPRGLQENKDSSSGDVKNKELKTEAMAKAESHQGNANDNKKRKQERKKGPATYYSGGDIPESELFRDPVHTLDKIAGGAPDLLKGMNRKARKPETLGAQGGIRFRDPFSPKSWQSLQKDLEDPADGSPDETGLDLMARNDGGAAKRQKARQGMAARRGDSATAKGHRKAPRAKKGRARPARKAPLAKLAAADRVYGQIKAEIKKALAHGDASHLPGVKVKRTKQGVLITVSDKAGFGMFEIGSAKPRRETVRFMDHIAAILRGKPGRIVLRGHTDGRPFRTDAYDNWRLSTARAHAARYMLLRGGIAQDRIVRIEGYADRKLAVPGDPLAASNRRIGILLLEK